MTVILRRLRGALRRKPRTVVIQRVVISNTVAADEIARRLAQRFKDGPGS